MNELCMVGIMYVFIQININIEYIIISGFVQYNWSVVSKCYLVGVYVCIEFRWE